MLITTVKLIENNNILKIQGLEAFDKSPVIDIKPYSKSYQKTEATKKN
ncbi:MAG: SAM-dependent methyltransferase [Deltaproteobacteria bacterium]|nr:SAM-dependent methyltransferase [Deltaproteobacteria bacterium]